MSETFINPALCGNSIFIDENDPVFKILARQKAHLAREEDNFKGVAFLECPRWPHAPSTARVLLGRTTIEVINDNDPAKSLTEQKHDVAVRIGQSCAGMCDGCNHFSPRENTISQPGVPDNEVARLMHAAGF